MVPLSDIFLLPDAANDSQARRSGQALPILQEQPGAHYTTTTTTTTAGNVAETPPSLHSSSPLALTSLAASTAAGGFQKHKQ